MIAMFGRAAKKWTVPRERLRRDQENFREFRLESTGFATLVWNSDYTLHVPTTVFS